MTIVKGQDESQHFWCICQLRPTGRSVVAINRVMMNHNHVTGFSFFTRLAKESVDDWAAKIMDR